MKAPTVKTIPEEWQETVGRALIRALGILRERLDTKLSDAELEGWDRCVATIREILWLGPPPKTKESK